MVWHLEVPVVVDCDSCDVVAHQCLAYSRGRFHREGLFAASEALGRAASCAVLLPAAVHHLPALCAAGTPHDCVPSSQVGIHEAGFTECPASGHAAERILEVGREDDPCWRIRIRGCVVLSLPCPSSQASDDLRKASWVQALLLRLKVGRNPGESPLAGHVIGKFHIHFCECHRSDFSALCRACVWLPSSCWLRSWSVPG